MTEVIINEEKLKRSGFVPVTYEGQEGIFLSKTLKASQMPYLMGHVVDGELVYDTDDIVIDVTPSNLVHLSDLSTDYLEGPFPVDSEEGLAILVDAGLNIE